MKIEAGVDGVYCEPKAKMHFGSKFRVLRAQRFALTGESAGSNGIALIHSMKTSSSTGIDRASVVVNLN